MPASVAWHDLTTGEAIAFVEHRRAVVFAHAEWSTADKELAVKTFPAPEVRRAMRGFVAIDVDATDDELPETMLATKRFRVVGVPTILVTDDLGAYPYDEYPSEPNAAELLRIDEYTPPEELAEALDGARRRSRRWRP